MTTNSRKATRKATRKAPAKKATRKKAPAKKATRKKATDTRKTASRFTSSLLAQSAVFREERASILERLNAERNAARTFVTALYQEVEQISDLDSESSFLVEKGGDMMDSEIITPPNDCDILSDAYALRNQRKELLESLEKEISSLQLHLAELDDVYNSFMGNVCEDDCIADPTSGKLRSLAASLAVASR